MGWYYPGNGQAARPYDEPGKPDRTNHIEKLRSDAASQIKAAKNHESAGYYGSAASNRSEAQRLRDEAQRLEDGK